MKHETLIDQLIFHEGLRLKPYKCTANKTTIGIGRNLDDKGISEQEALYLLENDLKECYQDLSRLFPDFYCYSRDRIWALVDLRFNIGPTRFRSFRKMIAAVHKQDWYRAAEELKDSLWWRQIQDDRKNTLYKQLKMG
jgi:lysozyme